jgi:SAM-dependent methyltransferase
VSLHERAARGYARAGARDYEAGRPGYPPEAAAWLAAELELRPGRVVLDLGAGTGKLTRSLLPTGAEVVAVEPVAEMRAGLPGEARALAGSAAAIPLSDGEVHAVTVAQALHWFATGEAFAEIHRVLAPGGQLGLIWNSMDESVPWVRAVQDEVHAHAGPEVPRYGVSPWRAELAASGRFGPLHEAHFRHEQRLDRAGLRARVASTSYIAALNDAARATVLAHVAEIVSKRPEPFALPYRVDAFWAQRT